MELSSSNVKKIIVFSYILGNGNPKKSSSYFRKGNPKKLLTFWRMELLSSSSKKFKKSTPRKFLILRENGVF